MPHILLLLAFLPSNCSFFLNHCSAGVDWCPKMVAHSFEQIWHAAATRGDHRVDLGHAPAIWLEVSPTVSGVDVRAINPISKQIYKGRSCFASSRVKLVVAMAETLFLWWRKHCADNANAARPASCKTLLSSLFHFAVGTISQTCSVR